jgi:hypothetical protein
MCLRHPRVSKTCSSTRPLSRDFLIVPSFPLGPASTTVVFVPGDMCAVRVRESSMLDVGLSQPIGKQQNRYICCALWSECAKKWPSDAEILPCLSFVCCLSEKVDSMVKKILPPSQFTSLFCIPRSSI